MKSWTIGGVIVGAMVAALTACTGVTANKDDTDGFPDDRVGDSTGIGTGPSMCTIDDTADAGLAPIGPNGCAVGTVIVYRKTLSPGAGGSAVGSAGEASATMDSADASDGGAGFAPMTPACAPLSCKPGQVGVVTWASAPGSPPGPPSSADAAADPSTTGDGDASASGGDAAPSGDGGAPDDGGTAVLADGGASGGDGDADVDGASASVPLPQCLGFVIKCIDAPPSCPSGQAPSFAPSGKWHCMPLCNPSDPSMVVISYGGQFGSTRVCAGAPPKDACAAAGDVWTWDYTNEEWVCRPKCDNGMYDQHEWNGQTVCVPC